VANRTARYRRTIHYVATMPRAGDSGVRECRQLFHDFARTADAPLYAELAEGIAEDDEVASLLLAAPPSQRLPVLLFAAVHWMLLTDPSDPLARFYPNLTAAGDVPTTGAFPAFRAFCGARADELAELLRTRRTQTNEIGRTALFVPPLGQLATECGALAHVDVGASAGLNLLIDHYDFEYCPGGAVAAGSAVTITCGTRGPVPVPAGHPPVAASIGLDMNPIDVRDPDQARWLEACVWPDQVVRFERLRAAIAIAIRIGVDVRRGDATAAVAGLLTEAASSGHPVVTTSWMLNYFSAAARQRFVAALDEAAESIDFTWLYAESPPLCPELPGMPPARSGVKQPTALVVVRWRRGRRDAVHLGDAHPHGRWLHWV
jgi:hypothetical protein